MDSPPRTLAFDAVGTLFYADPPVAEVYSAVARGVGIGLEPRAVRTRFAAAMRRFPPTTPLDDAGERERWIERVRFVFEGTPAERFDELFALLWNRFADPGAWKLYPDVEPALEIAGEAGLRSIVASNFDERLIPIVEALLPERFERTLPATALGAAKPELEFFRAIEKRLATPAERFVLFGDDARDDGAGATLAGWSYRLVSSDPAKRRPLARGSLATLIAELSKSLR